MKAVILCGGLGTRFSEETKNKPKPMIKIGEYPILFHIMKIYEKYGINDFVLALGYRGSVIKEFFNEYNLNKLNNRYCRYLKRKPKKINWNVEFCFSGLKTMTGGRILRLKNHLQKEENFLLTYGDGLANVDIKKLIKFHLKNKKIATVTAAIPSARFGALKISGNKVVNFQEKPQSGEGWINGGFFCFNKKIFKYIKNDNSVLEEEPLSNLAKQKNLAAYKHKKFWQCMDTRRDHDLLLKQWTNKRILWLKN